MQDTHGLKYLVDLQSRKNDMENHAEKFLDRYREIEEWVVNNLKVSEMKDLETMPKYKNLKSNLSFCRYLRNLLSHHDWKKAGEDLIIVTESAVRQVNTLYYSLNPVTLMRVAVGRKSIFAPAVGDKVFETVRVMGTNDYSYVPVVENDVVKGVFSAKTVLGIVAQEKNLLMSDNLTFRDIMDFISTALQEAAKYAFVSSDLTIEDVEIMFQGRRGRRKRLDLLLITSDGTQNGRLIGMVTPADIVGI